MFYLSEYADITNVVTFLDNNKKMKRKFCSISCPLGLPGCSSTEYKKFLPTDYMKNQVVSDLRKREKKAYSKLKTTLKEAMVPLKSK